MLRARTIRKLLEPRNIPYRVFITADIGAQVDAAKDAFERQLEGTAPDVLGVYDPRLDEPPQ